MTGMINAGYTFGFDNGNAIIAGINDGILRGAVSVGINYATQEANLDPLLGLMLMCQCIGVSPRHLTTSLFYDIVTQNIRGQVSRWIQPSSATAIARLEELAGAVNGRLDPFILTPNGSSAMSMRSGT